jgi:hypothetical protein
VAVAAWLKLTDAAKPIGNGNDQVAIKQHLKRNGQNAKWIARPQA